VSDAQTDTPESGPAPYPLKDRLLVRVVRGLSWALAKLPPGLAYAIGRRLGWIYGHIMRYHRSDAIDALTRAFPEKSASEITGIVNRMYLNLGMNIIDSFRMAADDKSVHAVTEVANLELLQAAYAEGRGVVFLTAHTGSWEILPTVGPLFGFDTDIVVKKIRPDALNDYLVEIRRKNGCEMIPAKKSFMQCLRSLKKKRVLGFMLDQNMTRPNGIFVNFFGRPACTTPGAALLAFAAKCPVVPVFAERLPGGRHRLNVIGRLDPPVDREPETIAAYTQMLSDTVEAHIRRVPDQWIWIHRRWRTVQLDETADEAGQGDPENGTV